MKVKLKDLGKISTGNTPSKNISEFYNSEDIGFVKPDIISELQIDYVENTTEYLAEVARNKARIVKKNAVFVTCIGNIGKIGIVKNKELAFNQQINAIEPNEKVLPKYLAYGIFANKRRLQAISNAPVVPIINKTQFGEFEIDIINDTKKQLKIVELLDKVSEVIANRKEELEKLNELIKARFIEMFGDPMTNPKKWPVCELSKYIRFLTSGSRGWAKYFTDEGEYFITIKNVKNCRITLDDVQHIVPPDNAEAKRTKVQEGDLLISITADLGRTGVVTKGIADYGGYINQHLTCIRLNQAYVRPLYVAYYMESDAGKEQFQSKNQSAVKAGLNFNSINTLRLIVPPVELQDAFIAFVAQTDKSKVVIQKALDEAQLLFDSLMQKYFGQ